MKAPDGHAYHDCLCDAQSQKIAGVVIPIQEKPTDKYLRHDVSTKLATDNAWPLHHTPTIRTHEKKGK